MKKTVLLFLVLGLFLSCGKSGNEDITVTDNFDEILDSVSEYNISGGACGEIVINELKDAFKKCDEPFTSQGSIDVCRKEVSSVMEWHYNQIDCDVLIDNKITRINKNYFSKINDELDKISSVSNNFKSGQCGNFVLDEINELFKLVNFEKLTGNPTQYLLVSRGLELKYAEMNCTTMLNKEEILLTLAYLESARDFVLSNFPME